MKCRFCGKFTMYKLNTKDPICGDCTKAIGGEWGWQKVKKMNPEHVFYALGIQEALSPHDLSVEEAWRARVAANHLALKQPFLKPAKKMGCLGTIVLLVFMLVVLFLIVVMVAGNTDSTSPSSKTQSPTVSATQDVIKITPKALYTNIIRKGKALTYQGKRVRMSGTVKHISDYGDMIGYYLYGKQGKGLVGWLDGKQNIKKGDKIVMVGTVTNIGADQVELTDCIVSEVK